jgi:hypothetical protein
MLRKRYTRFRDSALKKTLLNLKNLPYSLNKLIIVRMLIYSGFSMNENVQKLQEFTHR